MEPLLRGGAREPIQTGGDVRAFVPCLMELLPEKPPEEVEAELSSRLSARRAPTFHVETAIEAIRDAQSWARAEGLPFVLS